MYDLAGQVVQRITNPSGFYGNVDVRGEIVAAAHSGIWTWRVTATAAGPRLVPAREASGNASTAGEGLCMWDPGTPGTAGGLYAINVNRANFRVRVHPLTDADGDGLLLVGKPVRDFYLGSEGEGCEVDDATGALYISEEDVGIWRYDLTAPTGLVPPRIAFASAGPLLAPDIEGLALAGGVLYASGQNVAAPRYNWYSRYDATSRGLPRQLPHLGRHRVGRLRPDRRHRRVRRLPRAGLPQRPVRLPGRLQRRTGQLGTQNFKYASLNLVDGSP